MSVKKETLAAHWSKTRGLLWTVLAVWFVFAYILPLFVGTLNGISIAGFPLGYYMSAQGSIIVFVLLIFWFSSRQNAIDEEFGLAEDE